MTAMKRFSGDKPEKKDNKGKSPVGKQRSPRKDFKEKQWKSDKNVGSRKYEDKPSGSDGSNEKKWVRKERSFDNERPHKPWKNEKEDGQRPWRKRNDDNSRNAGAGPKHRESREDVSSSGRKPWERKDSFDKTSRKPWDKKEDSGKAPQRSWGSKDGSDKIQRRTFDKREDSGKDYSKSTDKSGKWNSTGSSERKSWSSEKNYKDSKPFKSSGKKIRQNPGKPERETDGSIRLNKYIANAGICSRREADNMIEAGAIMVNGKIVSELGTKIFPGDKVQIGDETLNPEKKVYLLLNKPKGYITTVDDPQERNTVMMLVKDACKERIYPVGRLDRNTSGLLLLTNDGEIAKKLTHPSHRVRKVYQVELNRTFAKADMIRMTEGIELEDGIMAVDEIAYTGKSEDKKVLGVVIHSGKNRIVRRMFEALDYEVVKLDRVAFANLTKKDLPRGRWRFLEENEINVLKMI